MLLSFPLNYSFHLSHEEIGRIFSGDTDKLVRQVMNIQGSTSLESYP